MSRVLVIAIAVATATVETLASSDALAHGEPCTSVGGEDTCPQGEHCSVQDGGSGVCNPPPCTKDDECAWPLVHCDLRRSPPVCIECYGSTECPPPWSCELDPRSFQSNRCVECPLGQASACANAAHGHRCLFPRQVCGCASNADCAEGFACNEGAECEADSRPRDSGAEAARADAAPPEAGTPPSGPPLYVGGGGCAIGAPPSELPVLVGALAVLVVLVVGPRHSRRR